MSVVIRVASIARITRDFIADIIRSFLTVCSFATILPVPGAEWTERGLRFFCPMLPAVGGLLGGLWALLLALLSRWSAGASLRGALMALAVLALTGGLHMDGFMDACDALFSRRDRRTRLRILSDPRAGAFAVMGCAGVLLLQSALFAELSAAPPLALAASVPVWSRLGMGLLLNGLPFAREGGLARTLGAFRRPEHGWLMAAGGLLLAGLDFFAAGRSGLALPAVWLAILVLWRRCCLSVFGGVAGDLLGAFVQLSETAMLLALACSMPGR